MPEQNSRPVPKKLPELLAPAGSPEAFRAAVAAGADAIYLSGKQFGARKFAPNFTDEQIEESIAYAHARGVRVYVTVNTLIHDRELRQAVDYLIRLWSIGVDAVLIQDMGLAALAHEFVPDLTLHASTQMTIHNAAGVRWAGKQGFSRVVLARELSLEEVRRIAEQTKDSAIGLEVFAHGALCYCYSGQCLLSSVIGGRSGNRGMCAQPCRKPYTLVTGELDEYGRPVRLHETGMPGQYLLSPKDLCTYRNLAELVHSPVVSLKIEGRMKSPEYVAIVVSIYRKALDAIAAGTWKPDPADERDLLLAFNRGFTPGYLFGKRFGELMGRDAPDNRGICIGTVTRFDHPTRIATLKLNSTIIPEPGDGLLIGASGPGGTRTGFSLNNAPVVRGNGIITIAIPEPVTEGALVSITFSRDLDARVQQIISHRNAGPLRQVPVDLAVDVDPSGDLTIVGKVVAGSRDVAITRHFGSLLSPARSRPLTRDQLEARMRKTGGTQFVVRDFALTYSGDMFAPVSAVNDARREFLHDAEEALVSASRPPVDAVEKTKQGWKDAESGFTIASGARNTRTVVQHPGGSLRLAVCTDSAESTGAAVTAGCDSIWFEPGFSTGCTGRGEDGDYDANEPEILAALGVCRDAGVRFILKLPRITSDNAIASITRVLLSLTGKGMTGCMVENAGTAAALISGVPSIALSGSMGLNIFNHWSACIIPGRFRLLTPSPELSREDLRVLINTARLKGSSAEFALTVQGLAEAMITKDCLLQPVMKCAGDGSSKGAQAFHGIRDATGHVFPVRQDSACRTHVLNAVEICLVDQLPEIVQIGIREIAVDARGRTPDYSSSMTRIYRTAITSLEDDPEKAKKQIAGCKDEIRRIAYGGLTAGHFIRGLKEKND